MHAAIQPGKGAALHLYMNRIWRDRLTKRGLFVYLGMLAPLLDFENDVTGIIAATVQTGMVVLFAARAIYGPKWAR